MDKVLYIAKSLASVFGSNLLPQYSNKDIKDYWERRNSTTTPKNTPTNE